MESQLKEFGFVLSGIRTAIESFQPATTNGIRSLHEKVDGELLGRSREMEVHMLEVRRELSQIHKTVQSSQLEASEGRRSLQEKLDVDLQEVRKSQRQINQRIAELAMEIRELTAKSQALGKSYKPQISPTSEHDQHPLKTLSFGPYPKSKEPSA